jgi:hypothetical protein
LPYLGAAMLIYASAVENPLRMNMPVIPQCTMDLEKRILLYSFRMSGDKWLARPNYHLDSTSFRWTLMFLFYFLLAEPAKITPRLFAKQK